MIECAYIDALLTIMRGKYEKTYAMFIINFNSREYIVQRIGATGSGRDYS